MDGRDEDDAQALAECQRRAEHRHDDDVQRQRAWHDDHGVQERGVAESRNNSCENPRVGGPARRESDNESPERSSSESLMSCVRRSDMPHRSLLVLLVAAIATLSVLTSAAQGQTPAPPPLTYERVITMTWKDLHDKTLQIATAPAFPDANLGW